MLKASRYAPGSPARSTRLKRKLHGYWRHAGRGREQGPAALDLFHGRGGGLGHLAALVVVQLVVVQLVALALRIEVSRAGKSDPTRVGESDPAIELVDVTRFPLIDVALSGRQIGS